MLAFCTLTTAVFKYLVFDVLRVRSYYSALELIGSEGHSLLLWLVVNLSTGVYGSFTASC